MGTEKFDALARLVGEARAQFEEFLRGKKVAATRARKALQEIKRLAQEARVEIQTLKKGPPAAPPPPAP
ncbi:MAG TPA: histone H1 [Planctomycetota bacterium]|jgi:hypothetical protein|nr:histone H1 [Planctomycetota bacterium]